MADENLLNKTADPIEIVWDKSTYIDVNGGNHRVIHNGIDDAERNNPQANTIIIPNTSLTDMVYPSDCILNLNGTLTESYMFDKMESVAKTYAGKNVLAMLAIKINNNVYNYLFTFKIGLL